METVLITGSNKGIGFEIARQLGEKGFHVIISGRNENRLQNALQKLKKANINASFLLMDVSDEKSISKAAMAFSKQNVKLNVLINNAGILIKEDRSILNKNSTVLEETVNVNSYGALLTTKYFLPYFNLPGRIINISSGGGSMTDSVGGWSPSYCVSKTLLNAITRQLAFELSNKNISVNAVCPGWVQTDMGGASAPLKVEQGAITPVWLAFEASIYLAGKFFREKKEIPW